MQAKLKQWQNNSTLAHILPFVVFMAMLGLLQLGIENPHMPWWRQHPEQWVYPLQCLVCCILLAFFWKNYDFRLRISVRLIVIAVLLGIGTIVIWVIPSILFETLNASNWQQPDWLFSNAIARLIEKIPFISFDDFKIWHLLGIAERNEGFDPNIWTGWQRTLAIGMRFFRMVIVVAFVEELFWRGFLLRYISDLDTPFQQLAYTAVSKLAFVLVCLIFALAHASTDWLAAVIFSAAVNLLAMRSKSLFACVLCHAVANLALGIFIMQTGKWGFW